jgi:hypothetical protein
MELDKKYSQAPSGGSSSTKPIKLLKMKAGNIKKCEKPID